MFFAYPPQQQLAPVAEDAPTPETVLFGEVAFIRSDAFQRKVRKHPGMFVHSGRLRTHGPFGLSIIDSDMPASELSVATTKANSSMQQPVHSNVCVGVHDVGVPGVRGSEEAFTFEIGREVAIPKALGVAVQGSATFEVCFYYREGGGLGFGGHLPNLDKMFGISGIRRAQFAPEQFAGGRAVPKTMFHASGVALPPPPPARGAGRFPLVCFPLGYRSLARKVWDCCGRL